MRLKKKALALALGLCLCGVLALAAKVMNVQVRDGQVRDNPSFLGKIVGKASYGQSVEVLGEQGDWLKVSLSGGASGWMHRSSLTTQQLALSGGSGASQGVSGKEMALAGKGFSAEVEADYRRSHGGDFAAINQMERISYDPAALLSFLAQGDIKPQGGAK
jgi:hypothetical protein